MESFNILMICVSAFIAVFLLLSILALVMKAIIVVFPQKAVRTDPAAIAALASVITSIYPNTSITKVEEIK